MKSLFIALLLSCGIAEASSAGRQERLCQLYGEQGNLFAELIQQGDTAKTINERVISKLPVSTKAEKDVKRRMESILSYVALMGFSPGQAGRLVYIKCSVGDFD